MDIIVKTTARLMFPFIILYGIYMAFFGHISPGGAFPAGVIVATGFVMLIVAFREDDIEHRFTKRELVDLKAVGGLMLIVLIIKFGLDIREALLATQAPLALWSGGFTVFSNIAGTMMIITALLLIAYTIERE